MVICYSLQSVSATSIILILGV
uniref:Uncharacterized protein n=1 Tax=Rhizophora mucronata TaxID=61149 RepID=A0A2P2PG88_RHIMU